MTKTKTSFKSAPVQGFHTNPERINKNGRPKKWVTGLKNIGYTQCQVNDTLEVMLAMNIKELTQVADCKDATILELTVASALMKSLKTKSLWSIETILNRRFGAPAPIKESESQPTITVVNPIVRDAGITFASNEKDVV